MTSNSTIFHQQSTLSILSNQTLNLTKIIENKKKKESKKREKKANLALDHRFCGKRKFNERSLFLVDEMESCQIRYANLKTYYKVQVNQKQISKEVSQQVSKQIQMLFTPNIQLFFQSFHQVTDDDIFYPKKDFQSNQGLSLYNLYDFDFQSFTEQVDEEEYYY